MNKKVKKALIRFIQFISIIILLVLGFVVYANWKIPHETQQYIYSHTDSIPDNSMAIVLGTSRYIGSRPNPYFTYRIEATKKLYDSGKIQAIVVSGDNRHRSYNEPRDMRRALTEVGVPDSIIYCDYAGFRTLDSVIRMGKVFKQNSFIVVSQEFHNERAIYIARHFGFEAFGFNARDINSKFGYRTKIREVFARVKVFIDIAMGTKPKFLGEPVKIEKVKLNDEVAQPDTTDCATTQIGMANHTL